MYTALLLLLYSAGIVCKNSLCKTISSQKAQGNHIFMCRILTGLLIYFENVENLKHFICRRWAACIIL